MKGRLPAIAVFLALCALATADPLSTPPGLWAERLVPIPAQRLADLEATAAERIRETRRLLNEVLAKGEITTTELASLYGRLGALYAAHRLYAGAELGLRNAQALDPQGFQWAYYAAHVALEQGEAEQALDYLSEATRLDPAYPTLPLRRGEALLGLNRLEEARKAYTQALEQPGLRAAALYGLAQIQLLERDWANAASRLREVLALQPDADAAEYPLGQALIGLGKRAEARQHLSRRGTIKPAYEDALADELRSLQQGARFHFERGLAATKRRDFAAAADAFAAGLAEEPGNARARTSYARALWLIGEERAAETALQRAIADAPEEPLPRFLLALVRDAADDQISAIKGYRDVLAIDPSHQGALSYLANLMLRRSDFASAANYFEQAIEAGATESTLFLHYWGALLYAGTHDRVLRDRLLAFDKRFPEPPVFRFLLARLLAGSTEADVTDAKRALEIASALQQVQPIPQHSELLALTLAASGEFTRAEELQAKLVEMARMTGAWMQAAMLEQTAKDYRAKRLPERLWSLQDPIFMPLPVDPDAVIRNYPAAQPY